MSARGKMYWFGILPITLCILVGILYTLVTSILDITNLIEANLVKFIVIVLLLVLDLICVFGIIIGGARDCIFQISYLFIRKKEVKRHKRILSMKLESSPKVVMLYCTCNDLDENAIEVSLKQNYDNFEFIILDDSSKPEYLKRVDAIAEKHNLRVIRRENRKGFKAGNLNNYLKNNQDEYDYIVVLDSDERLPSNYITDTLKYFIDNEKLAAVQAAHRAIKGNNVFQRLMAMNIKSETQYSYPAKCKYGFCTLMGHGMTISKKALQDVGFFPELVVEDLALTVLLNEKGYEIEFSPIIVCGEEFPSNYIITKKRQLRWQEGAIEVRKKLKKQIHSKDLSFYIKRDFQMHLVQSYRTVIFTTFFLILSLGLALLGFDFFYYFKYLNIVTLILSIVPLLKDIFTYLPTKEFWKLPFYLLLNAMVYSSYLPAMFVRVVWTELGKEPFFLVTAKGQHNVVVWQIIKHSILPFVFVSVIAVMTYFAYHSLAPSLTLIVAGVLSPILIILANIEFKEKKIKIDNKKVEHVQKDEQIENADNSQMLGFEQDTTGIEL